MWHVLGKAGWRNHREHRLSGSTVDHLLRRVSHRMRGSSGLRGCILLTSNASWCHHRSLGVGGADIVHVLASPMVIVLKASANVPWRHLLCGKVRCHWCGHIMDLTLVKWMHMCMIGHKLGSMVWLLVRRKTVRENRYLLIVRSMSGLGHRTRVCRIKRSAGVGWIGPIRLCSIDCWRSRFVHKFFGIRIEF